MTYIIGITITVMKQSLKIDRAQLKVVYVPIADLRLAEYNPRTHTPEALEQLKESIRRYGIVDPAIVNGAPAANGSALKPAI